MMMSRIRRQNPRRACALFAVLSLIVGMLISPLTILAQDDGAATPVVDAPEIQPSPTDSAPTPEDTPTAEATATAPQFAAAAAPPLTLNGQANDVTVPYEQLVVVSTSDDATLHVFINADCVGASFNLNRSTWDAYLPDAGTASFQAVSNADPTSVSPCRNVTWEVMARLSFTPYDGVSVSHDLTVHVNTWVVIGANTAASLVYWSDANCTGTGIDMGTYFTSMTEPSAVTHSFQAVSTLAPAIVSPCLNLTWEGEANTPLPTATSTATSTPLPTKTPLSTATTVPSFTPAPSKTLVPSATETPPVNTAPSKTPAPSNTPVPSKTPAPSATTVPTSTETPMPPPPLSVDGGTTSVVVSLGTVVHIATDPNATIFRFSGSDCRGSGYDTTQSTLQESNSVPTVIAFLAVWKSGSNLQSACLSVTWVQPTPDLRPPLTLDGKHASVVVQTGTSVRVATDEHATITVWGSDGCAGQGVATQLSTLDVNSPVPGVNSFRAILKNDPSITSDCLSVTWTAPTPTPTVTPTATQTATPTQTPEDNYPPLTLNGGTVSLTVPTQAIVHVLTDPKATLLFWDATDCSSPWSVNLNEYESYAAPGNQAHWSYRAAWISNPGLQSPCLTITFTDGPPTPTPTQTPIIPPSLTLNGSSKSIVAPPNAIVRVETETNADMTQWEGPNGCSGQGMPMGSNLVYVQVDYQSLWYYQASLKADPSIRSACLSITASDRTPVATSVVGGTPPGSSTEPATTPTTTDIASQPPAPSPPLAVDERTPAAAVSSLPNTGAGSPLRRSDDRWAVLVLAGFVLAVSLFSIAHTRRR